jgi:uncharacterized protein
MIIEREYIRVLKSRIDEPRGFIQVVYGPRQVGKTTLVLQYLNQIKKPNIYVSADAVRSSSTFWLEQQWDIARLKLKQEGKKEFILAIDEIQKIPNWSEIVKREWDTDTMNNISIKVIILGSSTLLLQKGLSESLAGRFETIYLSHWSYSEMKKAFNFDENQFVWFGGYPGSAALIGDEPRWKQYINDSLIDTVISKDIMMITRVDKPQLMRRLFELGCLYSGQILSYNKIIGQMQDAGNTTTLSHYLSLLDKAGLLAGLEKFSTKILRQRASIPKFQVHNTALISSQSHDTFHSILNNPEKWGRIVESGIGANLLNYSHSGKFNLYYWREQNNEVDFVLEKDDKIIGLEIKSGFTEKLSGITYFKKHFNPYKIFVIGKSGINWKDFIKINPNELF